MKSWKQCALPIIATMLCGNSCTWAHDVTVHHVPKCMGCHKAIVVITGRAHCFHGCIYYAHLAFVRFEHSVCHESLTMTIMTTYTHTHTHTHTHTRYSMYIVHPTQCFKSFYPVYFVNQMGKIINNNIFWRFDFIYINFVSFFFRNAVINENT